MGDLTILVHHQVLVDQAPPHLGEVQDENPISVFDHNFGVQVSYFEKKARFEQAIKLLSENVELTVDIAYMVCNESMCIPFNESFQINLKN